jgi:hypothetical protein
VAEASGGIMAHNANRARGWRKKTLCWVFISSISGIFPMASFQFSVTEGRDSGAYRRGSELVHNIKCYWDALGEIPFAVHLLEHLFWRCVAHHCALLLFAAVARNYVNEPRVLTTSRMAMWTFVQPEWLPKCACNIWKCAIYISEMK